MSTKRQREAAARFAATVEECRGDLHHDDLIFEPRNFDNWMVHCDRGDEELLKHSLDMTRRMVATGNAGSAHQKLRTHFRDYAEAALNRRYAGWDIPF